MDVEALHGLFAATLNPLDEARQSAEHALRQADAQPQFIASVLRIILEPQVQFGVRIAAAVYLKNKVQLSWVPSQSNPGLHALNAADKQNFRAQIVEALAEVPLQIRQILLHTVAVVIAHDFPDNWPELLPKIQQLLTLKEPMPVYTAFSLFLLVSRQFRYSSLKGFADVADNILPSIVAISESLMNETNQITALMLYDFTKIIKMSIARSLPPAMQNPEFAGRVVQLLLGLVVKTLPEDVQVMEASDREWHPWAKTKKWATYDLLRIHNSYIIVGSSLSDRGVKYADFRKMYKTTFSPEVSKTFIGQLQLWSVKRSWFPQPAIFNILSYLRLIIDSKSGWALVEPHVEGIIGQVIYPLLCPSDEDIDLFEDDPVEYLHRTVDDYPETPYPDVAAANFLSKLAQKRKSTFGTVVQFVQQTVNELNDGSLASAVKKIGVLRILQTLSPTIMARNNPIKDQMEPFLAQFVLPDFESPHGILKSRACQLVTAFSSLEFKERENLQRLYHGTMKCLYDHSHFPVQVDAAIAIEILSKHEDVHAALGQHVKDIVQLMLELTKKIDLESLRGALDELVAAYPEQVTSFAIDMAGQLKDQFLVLASDIHEAANIEPEDYDWNSTAEDKLPHALGILKSISSLQLSLYGQSELLQQLGDVITPIFDAVYIQELDELYVDTFSLHENTLYSMKAVPPTHWRLLNLALRALEQDDYASWTDALPLLENYVHYGGEYIASNHEVLQLFIAAVTRLIGEETTKIMVDDRILALMLCIRMFETKALQGGAMDSYIDGIVGMVLNRMIIDKERLQALPAYAFNLVAVILSAIFNNAAATLISLGNRNMIDPFLMLWFQTMDSFNRVDDLKLQELAILSLISLEANEIPHSVQQIIPQLLETLVKTLENLPGAMARQSELAKDLESSVYDDGYDYEESWSYDEREEEEEDEEDSQELKIVMQTQQGAAEQFQPAADTSTFSRTSFEFYEPDQWGDETFPDSPLENIDPFVVLSEALNNLAHTRPDYYHQLINSLKEQDKAVIQDSVSRASSSQASA